MTGPSTMKHHQELHERIRALEAPAALRDSYGHDVRLHERIRALEAEVADLKEREIPAWLRLEKTWYDKNHELEAHVKELETVIKELTAMLYELRSQRDYAIAIQEDRER